MSFFNDLQEKTKQGLKDFFSKDNKQRNTVLVLIGLCLLVTLSYLNSIAIAAVRWNGAEYSHAYFVPLFSLFLLFTRRQPIDLNIKSWERWVGVGIIAFALGARVYFAQGRYFAPDMYTYVIAMAGVFMLVGGLKTMRWSAAPVLFLIFMFPLPDTATYKIRSKLQGYATMGSHYVMETVGINCFREGHTIVLTDSLANETKLEVVDQCSGLRMLTIFIALSIAIAIMYQGAWWERIVILASAIPIALISNMIRISITGILHRLSMSYDFISRDFVNQTVHDYAGWFMMPIGLGLLYLELVIMSKLFIEDEPHDVSINLKHGSAGMLVPK